MVSSMDANIGRLLKAVDDLVNCMHSFSHSLKTLLLNIVTNLLIFV
jgi:hypothetical protein